MQREREVVRCDAWRVYKAHALRAAHTSGAAPLHGSTSRPQPRCARSATQLVPYNITARANFNFNIISAHASTCPRNRRRGSSTRTRTSHCRGRRRCRPRRHLLPRSTHESLTLLFSLNASAHAWSKLMLMRLNCGRRTNSTWHKRPSKWWWCSVGAAMAAHVTSTPDGSAPLAIRYCLFAHLARGDTACVRAQYVAEYKCTLRLIGV
jgi:hypothetical protein